MAMASMGSPMACVGTRPARYCAATAGSSPRRPTAVTTTSADLVFTGEITGDFLVLDGRTGKELYRFNTGGPINGGVITYAVNGKQYVAVMSGNATSFWQARPGSSTAIVFALP